MQKKKIRDKERTKERLLRTVGKILKKDGHKAIRINKVARVSGVNKKLIYDNFGGIDGLINTYLKSVDVWVKEDAGIAGGAVPQNPGSDVFFSILETAFNQLKQSDEMQKIILWGLTEKNKMLQSIMEEREAFGETLLRQTDKTFNKTDVDFRAVTAILLSGLYYMILHGSINNSTICGIDVSGDEGKHRMLNTIKMIFDWTFKKAK